MNSLKRPITSLLIALLPLSLGCATARLGRFHTFAQAGATYTAATQTVTQDAGTAAVNAGSEVLLASRPSLTESQRREKIARQNELLKERLRLLRLISEHGKLLQAYFEALAALSDPKAPNSVGIAVQQAYDSLAKMSPMLKNFKVGPTTVSGFISIAAAPVVADFKVRALNRELKARSGAITNELALQEAAFKAIAAELKTDTQLRQNLRENDSVNQFASAAPLPTEWANQRLILLSTPPALASLDAASNASMDLRKAFKAVAENRFDNEGFESLMNAISSILSLTQNVQSAAR